MNQSDHKANQDKLFRQVAEEVDTSITKYERGRAVAGAVHNTAFFLGYHTALLVVWLRRFGQTSHPQRTPADPPSNAEFFFYLFMAPATCDALVGDLEERYKLIHKKFGRRRANFWYWTQAVTSVGPIVWAWAKNVVMKPAIAFAGWAVARGLVGHDSWLAALVELWKKVRS